jgi:hypothetical protein
VQVTRTIRLESNEEIILKEGEHIKDFPSAVWMQTVTKRLRTGRDGVAKEVVSVLEIYKLGDDWFRNEERST